MRKASRNGVIRRLTDPNYLLAPWLEKHVAADDPLRHGFVPCGSDLRDFSIIFDRGCWHVFYIDLRHGKSSRRPDNFTFIGHASTTNFQQWTVHEPALHIVPGTWEGGHIGPAHVVPVKNNRSFNDKAGYRVRFVMIYTGISRSLAQRTGMAFSRDLFRWDRYEGNPVLEPEHFGWALWARGSMSNCRDPYVLQHRGRYILYYTALRKDGQACIAAAGSSDLENWRDLGPVLTRPASLHRSPAMLESACVHPLGRRYVLFYSYEGHTWFTISSNPERFDSAGERLVEGLWGLKVVKATRDRWLVAFFRESTGKVGGAALFSGRDFGRSFARFPMRKIYGVSASRRPATTSAVDIR